MTRPKRPDEAQDSLSDQFWRALRMVADAGLYDVADWMAARWAADPRPAPFVMPEPEPKPEPPPRPPIVPFSLTDLGRARESDRARSPADEP